MKEPLLSICIPTYNRCNVLDDILGKMVCNQEFDNSVEIIISDNCSTDNTENVAMKYVAEHANVFYYKNEENINDANFIRVLNLAHGSYLKLLNDWCYLSNESMAYVKEMLKKHEADHTPVFFTNDWLFTKNRSEVMQCHNLDEYIQRVSTFVTSIGIFGTWKRDWEQGKEKEKYLSYKLMQVDWTYQIAANRGCVIYNRHIYGQSSAIEVHQRSGYNWFQVHLDNYYKIMKPYCEKQMVSKKTQKNDRKYLLKHFTSELCQIYIQHRCKRWAYDTDGMTGYLLKYYHADLYFYYFMFTLPIKWATKRRIRHFTC